MPLAVPLVDLPTVGAHRLTALELAALFAEKADAAALAGKADIAALASKAEAAALAALLADGSPLPVRLAPGQTYRTLSTRAADILWAEDYGCVGDGIHDDGPAIQAALNAAPIGGTVKVRGTVNGSLIATPVTLDKCVSFITKQRFTINSGIVAFTINGRGVEFVGPVFTGNRNPASMAILINGVKAHVGQCRFEHLGYFIKVAAGYEALLFNLDMRNAVTCPIWLWGSVGPKLIEATYDTDFPAYPMPTVAGIWLQTQGATISHCDIIHGGAGGNLLIQATADAPTSVYWNFIESGCQFDTNDGPGIHITNDAASGKVINGVFISNSWSSSNWINLLIDGTGSIDGVVVTDTQMLNSYGPAGVFISQGSNINLDGCHVIASAAPSYPNFSHQKADSQNSIVCNTPGVVTIRGGTVRARSHGLAATMDNHLIVGPLTGKVDIDGTSFDRFVAGAVLSDSSASGALNIGRCPGLNTYVRGFAKIRAGQTTTGPLVHGLDVKPQGYDIMISPISAGVANPFEYWVDIQQITPTTFAVVCNTAPTSDFFFAFKIETSREVALDYAI